MHLSRLRPRFTVRRLMVAVAVVGMALGLMQWMRMRSAGYARRAKHFASMMPSVARGETGVPGFWARQEYYGKMYDKYRRAARYPWLPVEPDPPEPK